MARITVEIKDSTRKFLKLLAVIEGKTLNSLVQDALDRYMSEKGRAVQFMLDDEDLKAPAVILVLTSAVNRGFAFAMTSFVLLLPVNSFENGLKGCSAAIRETQRYYATPASSMRRLGNLPAFQPSQTFDLLVMKPI